MHPETDAEAITASLTDPERFAAIFDRHYDVLQGYLRRRAGSDLGDEIAAQTFLVAFDRRGGYLREHASARPWLFGIASNLLRGRERAAARELRAYSRLGADDPPSAFDGAESRADADHRRSELIEALLALSPAEADVLLLYAWAEMSYTEIAASLEIPVGTVRSRLARARAHIRELLAPDRTTSDSKRPEGRVRSDG